jgi:hypothetical protein
MGISAMAPIEYSPEFGSIVVDVIFSCGFPEYQPFVNHPDSHGLK